jgi:hypothetical protein
MLGRLINLFARPDAPPRPPAPPTRPVVGDVVGDRYALRSLRRHDGSTWWFEATDLQLQREVDVHMTSAGADGASISSLLSRRAPIPAVMRLSHPSIARLYHWDRHPPWEILVLERVRGPSLAAVVEAAPARCLPPATAAVGLTLDLLDALAAAHAEGVGHHNLQPRSLILTTGDRLKVCGFGVPAAMCGDAEATDADQAGGLAFVSPEQLRGAAPDTRSDLYAVGGILAYLLTGRLPFRAGPGGGQLILPLAERASPALRACVEGAMALAPADRPTSARQLHHALEAAGFRSFARLGRDAISAGVRRRRRAHPAGRARGVRACRDLGPPDALARGQRPRRRLGRRGPPPNALGGARRARHRAAAPRPSPRDREPERNRSDVAAPSTRRRSASRDRRTPRRPARRRPAHDGRSPRCPARRRPAPNRRSPSRPARR